MKITAIIAEYNPFHNGHLKHLRLAKKETSPDALVVVMSGSFTQHGDMAVASKYQRAEWAIAAGADAVIELPTVYSLSYAQKFAEGALKTLSLFGDVTLSFGTEAEELENLSITAEFMQSESNDMSYLLKDYLSQGYSLAKSRTLALNTIRPDLVNMLNSPNNILAVEYMKAAAKFNKNTEFHTVARKGDDGKKYLSSTKIREKMYNGEDVAPFVPKFVNLSDVYSREKYNTMAIYAMKSTTKETLKEIYNINEGFENRIAGDPFTDMNGYLQLTSKRYTRSTIKRIAACATVGVSKELVKLAEDNKPYSTLLAIRPSKKKLLLPYLAESDGYFFYKPSDCPEDCPIKPLIDLDEKAYRIQQLCKF